MQCEVGRGFLDPWAAAVGRHVARMNAAELAQVLQALVHWKHRLRPGCMRDLAKHAIRRIEAGCDPQALSVLCWGLAQVGYRPNDIALHSILQQALAVSGSASGRSASQLMWALASFKVAAKSAPKQPLATRNSGQESLGTSAMRHASPHAEQSSHETGQHPDRPLSQHAATSAADSAQPAGVLHSNNGVAAGHPPSDADEAPSESSSLGLQESDDQPATPASTSSSAAALCGALGRLGQQVWAPAGEAAPGDVAAACWALAKACCRLKGKQKAQLLSVTGAQLQLMSPTELSTTLWALTKLQATPTPDWWAGFLQHSEHKMPQMSHHALAIILWALAEARMRPPIGWMSAFMKQTWECLPLLNFPELCKLLWAFSELNIEPGRRWITWCISTVIEHVENTANGAATPARSAAAAADHNRKGSQPARVGSVGPRHQPSSGDISKLLSSAAVLQQAIPDALLHELAEACAQATLRRLQATQPGTLCSLAAAFVKLRAECHVPYDAAWVAEWYSATERLLLKSADAKGPAQARVVVDILTHAAQLGCPPSESWLALCRELLRDKQPDLAAADVAWALSALGRLEASSKDGDDDTAGPSLQPTRVVYSFR